MHVFADAVYNGAVGGQASHCFDVELERGVGFAGVPTHASHFFEVGFANGIVADGHVDTHVFVPASKVGVAEL